MAGVCVEPFPTHSFDGGLFQTRRCLLVDRALTGSLDGRTVEMDGDGTQPDWLFCWLVFHCLLSQQVCAEQERINPHRWICRKLLRRQIQWNRQNLPRTPG